MESPKIDTPTSSGSDFRANVFPGCRIFSEPEWLSLAGSLRLSERELEIVQRIFDDQTQAAAASQLGISPHTVHTYLERLYRKLDVNTRCAAVIRVLAEYLRQHPGSRVAAVDDTHAAHSRGPRAAP